jgi:hypothetical protein
MPIEIKELHIRVSVNAPQGQPSAGGQPAATPAGGGGQDNDKDAIVAECVEQVLEILQNKAER